MPKVRSLLLISACCLGFGTYLTAQTAGSYFQTLVKDAKTRIKEISVDQFKDLRTSNPSMVVVDVREDNEWNQGRIPGAVHVGRGVLESTIESKVPQKTGAIVVYCRGGGRSAVAADVLGKMGYTNVSSLAGGITAYQAAHLPIEKDLAGEKK